MCIGGSPPAMMPAPSANDTDVQAARLAERQRAARAAGRASTILTGGAGDLSPAPSVGKFLLGA